MVDGVPPHTNSLCDGSIVYHPKQRAGTGLLRPRGGQLPEWQLGGRVGNISGLGVHRTLDGGLGIDNGLCGDGGIGHNKSHGAVLLVFSRCGPPNDSVESGHIHRELVHVRQHMFGIGGTVRRIQGESNDTGGSCSFATMLDDFFSCLSIF